MRNGRRMITPPTWNSAAATAEVRRSGLFIGDSLHPASRRIVRRPKCVTRFWVTGRLDRQQKAVHPFFLRPTPWGGKGLTTTKGGTMKARHSLACTLAALSLVALHARADSDRDRERDRDRNRTTTVDCAAGDTVARALRHGDERKSLTILVNGTCNEHVVINRSDIKLAAATPGATISGPDPTIDVIRVTGTRVTIDGITVTGGRNGITADGAAGLIVPNAVLPGNLRNGINLASASADIIGGNTISGHTGGTGVNLVRSSAIFGDALFDFTTVNTISGNGSPASQGGIFAFNGSSVTIRDAIITNNVGAGVVPSFRSQAQISGNTI